MLYIFAFVEGGGDPLYPTCVPTRRSSDLRDVLGAEREAVLARELTKTFETLHGDQLGALYEWVEADSNQQRGEFVLVVAGVSEVAESSEVDEEHLLQVLLEELPVKQAASLAARITGGKRNALYAKALELQKDNSS